MYRGEIRGSGPEEYLRPWPEPKRSVNVDVLDRLIEIHKLSWADGGGVITYENLFKIQELADNYILDMVNEGKVTVKQNLDGRIISVQRRAVR